MILRIFIFVLILSWILLWPKSERQELAHAIQQAIHPRQHSSGERLIGGVSLIGLVCCILVLALIWFSMVPTD